MVLCALKLVHANFLLGEGGFNMMVFSGIWLTFHICMSVQMLFYAIDARPPTGRLKMFGSDLGVASPASQGVSRKPHEQSIRVLAGLSKH